MSSQTLPKHTDPIRAATCFALIGLFLFGAFVVDVVKGQSRPLTTIRQFNTEPFRDWADRSDATMPEDIQIRVGGCIGGACVNIQTGVMIFPQSYINDPGWHDARAAFYHESGHIFQLENNDEVQGGYPALDLRCEGVFTGSCAQNFADRYKACAMGYKSANGPTCAFIEEVAA